MPAPTPSTGSTPGQNGTWTFTGTAGQRVYFDYASGTFGGLSRAQVTVKKPDGGTLALQICGTPRELDTPTLAAAGAYTIVLDPAAAYTGALTARLYAVPADASVRLTGNGGGQRLTTTAPGQNAIFTFTGSAGQIVTVGLTASTFGVVSFTIRQPDSITLITSGGSGNITFSNLSLPVAGDDTVVANPSGTAVGGVTAVVTS